MTQLGLFPGIAPTSTADMTPEDWYLKSAEISQLFSPNAPVKESDLFAGRERQIRKMIDAVFQDGQHVVIYGDRGVGKTSLTNTFAQKVFAKVTITKFFPVQCFKGDDFMRIWERALKNHQWTDGEYAFDDIDDALTPDSLLSIAERFSQNVRPVFIFDEFDRITDKPTKTKMAETIKLLSDRAPNATVIIAGIGRTIRDLLEEHDSVRRAIRQVEMPRMSSDEIREIINKRIPRAGMAIEPGPLGRIVALARGMPGYAHLLGMYSAQAAISRRTLTIDDECLLESLNLCLEEAGESTKQAYAKATQSAKPNNQFKQVLLACAIAPQDEFGAFTAASMRGPVTRVLGSERDIPAFARHLNQFCSEGRGPILEKDGTPKNYRYRFIDPMMQSYVIIKGLKDSWVDYDDAAANLV